MKHCTNASGVPLLLLFGMNHEMMNFVLLVNFKQQNKQNLFLILLCSLDLVDLISKSTSECENKNK